MKPSVVCQRLTALWLTPLMNVLISAVIIALIQRLIGVVSQRAISLWVTTRMRLWISAMITVPIQRLISVVSQRAVTLSLTTEGFKVAQSQRVKSKRAQ